MNVPSNKIIKQEYGVRFVTPAFLGDAEQNGAWRVPPFKALLRQWWRIVAAKGYGYDHKELRKSEGRLFGNAWLEKKGGGVDARKSLVRLRLSHWESGRLQRWYQDPRLTKAEVKNPVGAHLYLGYGPLEPRKGQGTGLKMKTPVDSEKETATLSVIYPIDKEDELIQVVRLMHLFGTLGGRSRNGWGSLQLENSGLPDIQDVLSQDSWLFELSRPLDDCLELDWPHASGRDHQGLLIWNTQRCTAWSDVMRSLALAKIKYRTALRFEKSGFSLRHLLAYPVTKHDVREWGDKARLANQLRFKVAKVNNEYIGIAYHLPCALPKELLNQLSDSDQRIVNDRQAETWVVVHRILDDVLARI